MNENEFFLTLAEIASWPPFEPMTLAGAPSMIAGVPSLQRGLVWDPGRVELLWDSLFRGFPVGSFVACDRLDDEVQATRGVPGREGRHPSPAGRSAAGAGNRPRLS